MQAKKAGVIKSPADVLLKEDIMNIFKSTGVAVGLMVGLMIAVIIFKVANTNHKAKTEYDERQKEIRGKAYMYAFYTVVALECVMMIVDIGGVIYPFESYLLHFAAILAGCTVLCCYSIWHDVYWGLNNDPRRYSVIFIATALLNLIPIIGAVKSGTLMVNGKFTLPFMNIMVMIMLAIIGVVFFVKNMADSRREEE